MLPSIMPQKASIKATKPKRRLRLPSLLHRQSADHQGGKWPLLESCYREERNVGFILGARLRAGIARG
jgi:hypothetical protein